jgi:WD40 repeat protein
MAMLTTTAMQAAEMDDVPDQVTLFTEGKRPMNAALSPDGRTAAINVSTGDIYLCDALTGDVKSLLRGHSKWTWLEFSPDSKLLASGGSQDRRLRLWDVETGNELALLGEFKTQISMVRFSPDGKKLASSQFVLSDPDRDGEIRIWDVERQVELATFVADNGLTDIAFSPDGRYLASAEYAKKKIDLKPLSEVRIWDVQTGKTVRRFPNRCGTMSRVKFSPDGKTLAIAAYHAPHVLQASHRVELIDTETWNLKRALTGHTRRIFGLAFTADGKTLLTSGSDGTLRVWDLQSFAQKMIVPISSGNTGQLTLSADGQRFAIVSKTAEVIRIGVLKDTAGYELSKISVKTGEAIGVLRFSDDGKNLAATRGRNLHYWDATTSSDLPPLKFDSSSIRALSPDLRLAVSAYRTIDVWDVTTRKKVHSFPSTRSGTYEPIFSRNGRFLAAAAPDQSIKIWDLKSGRLWAAAPRQTKNHSYLTFTPDGTQLVSSEFAPDGRIVIWNLPPKDTPPAKQVATPAPDKQDDQPGNEQKKVPEKVTEALKKAYQLVTNRMSSFQALRQAIGPVVAQLPDVTPHTGKQPAKWHRLTVNRDGSRFAVVKFQSPLKKDADMEWAFITPHMTNWYILPLEGTMKGFKNFSRVQNIRVKGAQLPEKQTMTFQRLTGGELKPGREYLLWFRYNTTERVDLQLCLHLSEAGTHKDVNNATDIARAMGIKTPFEYSTATNIPLQSAQVLKHGKYVTQIVVSPNGKLLASVDSTDFTKLWDLETGKVLRTFKGGLLAFSPDGKTMAVSGISDNPTTVFLFQTETGTKLHTFRDGHIRKVLRLAFSTDGKRLASGGAAGVVALWDLKTGGQNWSAFNFE